MSKFPNHCGKCGRGSYTNPCPVCRDTEKRDRDNERRHRESIEAQDRATRAMGDGDGGGNTLGGCVVMVVIAVAVGGFLLSKCSGSEKNSAVKREKQTVTTLTPEGKQTQLPQGQNESHTITPEVKQSQPSQAQKPKMLSSLEGVPLPCMLIVTERVSLLDFKGKETSIPVGTSIEVLSRKKLGSLEIQIKGATFVGNESRLAGKVQFR